ncbi:MAG: CPBP family intramembrane glutamic endopeptidase [Pseudomonadota bacterium]
MMLLLPALTFAMETLSNFHYAIHSWSAYHVWRPVWDISHPASEVLWGLAILASTYAVYVYFHRGGREYDGISLPEPTWTIWKIAIFTVILTWGVDLGVERLLETRIELPDTWPTKPDWYYHITPAMLPGTLFAAVIVAPLVEEYLFRGLGMGCLLERGWSPVIVVLVTSALFAFTHTQYLPSGMFLIFVSGVIFGYLRLVSGALTLPVISHALLNLSIYVWYAAEGFPSIYDGPSQSLY